MNDLSRRAAYTRPSERPDISLNRAIRSRFKYPDLPKNGKQLSHTGRTLVANGRIRVANGRIRVVYGSHTGRILHGLVFNPRFTYFVACQMRDTVYIISRQGTQCMQTKF
jgi:hypothetical protein